MARGRGSGDRFFRSLAIVGRRSEQRRGFFQRLRNRLLVGFLVAFPLVVTIFFARFIFGLLDKWFRPISKHFLGFPLFGVGMLLALIGLYLLGALAANVFGGRLLGVFERWISRLPLLGPLYHGARQITEAIQIRETSDFRQVVLLAFPHPGVRSVGFVTREFRGPTCFSEEGSVLVFVPTTPNPTSGFLVAVPRKEVEPLEISVEEGVKLVISGGMLTPEVLIGSSAASPSGTENGTAVRSRESEDEEV